MGWCVHIIVLKLHLYTYYRTGTPPKRIEILRPIFFENNLSAGLYQQDKFFIHPESIDLWSVR